LGQQELIFLYKKSFGPITQAVSKDNTKRLGLPYLKLKEHVDNMREISLKRKSQDIINDIRAQKPFLEKCVLMRAYLSPASNKMEFVIKLDLEMENSKDNTSGDAIKNGTKYEIKYSGHSTEEKFNFNQIRPDHDIHYYVFIGYNLYEEDLGKVYTFKIPSEIIYNLLIEYGSYTHGTIQEKGPISRSNLKGNNSEYSLRVSSRPTSGTKDEKL